MMRDEDYANTEATRQHLKRGVDRILAMAERADARARVAESTEQREAYLRLAAEHREDAALISELLAECELRVS